MNRLSEERCFNHNLREAAALCPECRRFFCRECVTEHDDRVICASCLKKLAIDRDFGRGSLARLLPIGKTILGFMFLWLMFYYLGEALLRIPASVHDGSLWRDTPSEIQNSD